MKLIVGLGNPGRIYAGSRHNIGFTAIEALAQKNKISFRRDSKTSSLTGKGKIEGQDLALAMPLTFMNLSGKAVRALVHKYSIDLKDLLVVCDDLDLELGRVKIRPCGSSGGHRGLQSITEALKSKEFARLRVGISRPQDKDADISGYVLCGFKPAQKRQIKGALKDAASCCQAWISGGITKSMNIFNRRGVNK